MYWNANLDKFARTKTVQLLKFGTCVLTDVGEALAYPLAKAKGNRVPRF